MVAAKDLRIELRSRVLINQVLPFAAIVMVLFAFALDNDDIVDRVAPGLIWLATLFSLLVLVQRSFAVETADGALDALRTAGVPAQGIFFGKALALAAAARGARGAAVLRGVRALQQPRRRRRRGAAGHELASRYLRAGLRRYALRRSRRRNQGSGIAAPAAVAPGRGASSDRCNPSDRSGARRRRNLDARRLGLGGAAGRLCARCSVSAARWPSARSSTTAA